MKVAWVSMSLNIKLETWISSCLSVLPSSKIRPKEPDSQANAFSSPSHRLPVTQRREILGQMHGFHKGYFISFCVPFFREMGRNEWVSLAFQLWGMLSWRESPFAELGLGDLGIWTCASAGGMSHCCSDEQWLRNLLSLPKCTPVCLIFLKSLSFKDLSFWKHMYHLKLFMALWKSKCTF